MNPNVDEDPVLPLAFTSSSASTNFVSLCDYELSSSDEEREEVNISIQNYNLVSDFMFYPIALSCHTIPYPTPGFRVGFIKKTTS